MDSKHISAILLGGLPCPFFQINISSKHFLIKNFVLFNLIHSREIISPSLLLDSALRNCGAAPTHTYSQPMVTCCLLLVKTHGLLVQP